MYRSLAHAVQFVTSSSSCLLSPGHLTDDVAHNRPGGIRVTCLTYQAWCGWDLRLSLHSTKVLTCQYGFRVPGREVKVGHPFKQCVITWRHTSASCWFALISANLGSDAGICSMTRFLRELRLVCCQWSYWRSWDRASAATRFLPGTWLRCMHTAPIAWGIVGFVETARLGFSLSSAKTSTAYGLYIRGLESHTCNLRISLEPMLSLKLLSLSENIFVQTLSSPLRHTLLGARFLRVIIGELLLAKTMTCLQKVLFFDWGHTELGQVYDWVLYSPLRTCELDSVLMVTDSVPLLIDCICSVNLSVAWWWLLASMKPLPADLSCQGSAERDPPW